MPEPTISIMSPVVYDATTRELRTVRQYFIDHGIPEDIQWQADVVEGASIEEGKLLAHIIWTSRPAQRLPAPVGCAGRIAWLNTRIAYEVMHRRSIILLRLATS
jgi:hypothetical protein